VTDKELKVLRASEKEKLLLETNVPAESRQAIIKSLADRGLIEVETKIKEVWLCAQGQEYLRDDYSPKGSQPVISLDMLNDYRRFCGNPWAYIAFNVSTKRGFAASASEVSPVMRKFCRLFDLDRQLNTEITYQFFICAKLEPLLSREN